MSVRERMGVRERVGMRERMDMRERTGVRESLSAEHSEGNTDLGQAGPGRVSTAGHEPADEADRPDAPTAGVEDHDGRVNSTGKIGWVGRRTSEPGRDGEGGERREGPRSDEQGVALLVLAVLPIPKELAEMLPMRTTGSTDETLKRIGKAISTYPEGFKPHRNLARILNTRRKTVEEGRTSTRQPLRHLPSALSPSRRSTYRHTVIHDQDNEQQYVPLNALGSGKARFVVCTSSLSEFGIGTLGFETGYLLVSPDALTIWDAQFGDREQRAVHHRPIHRVRRVQVVAVCRRRHELVHGFDDQGPGRASSQLE
ncbi:uncharacterized protein B0H18DRAFT_1108400 [Fomitopsis serialis]|uniref:uncharacterized protein n=1 Tax=Fomitopsis serialis TaxID=139415 RepID=UPI0020078AC0|nr:uncharacterized protein B0H18DRAFT_1108400 [Neoantrodia serialis]KAH9914337.1 hypothetical protein B0H18DRAFT_1108400 [Neoantrodia serialis]